jgi:hypothetical protein
MPNGGATVLGRLSGDVPAGSYRVGIDVGTGGDVTRSIIDERSYEFVHITFTIVPIPLYTRYCLGVRELERDQRRRARALR